MAESSYKSADIKSDEVIVAHLEWDCQSQSGKACGLLIESSQPLLRLLPAGFPGVFCLEALNSG